MTHPRTLQVTVVIITLLALVIPLTQSWAADPMPKPMAMDLPPKAITLEQLNAKQLPFLVKALENARKAVDMGHKDLALMELKNAQNLLAVVQQTIAMHVKPEFANTACPIMGIKIDASKLPASLIREFNGQKVGFCCGGCPAQWDKLSDAEKQAKLLNVQASNTPRK